MANVYLNQKIIIEMSKIDINKNGKMVKLWEKQMHIWVDVKYQGTLIKIVCRDYIILPEKFRFFLRNRYYYTIDRYPVVYKGRFQTVSAR